MLLYGCSGIVVSSCIVFYGVVVTVVLFHYGCSSIVASSICFCSSVDPVLLLQYCFYGIVVSSLIVLTAFLYQYCSTSIVAPVLFYH